MIDQYKRKIDYMRISVTDRCNLRCEYCMPEDGIQCIKHEDILTYEEICKVVEATAELGIEKIKITGGEPLVRKGIVNLVEKIKHIKGIKQVTMTSNGVLLKDMAQDLVHAGLDAVNISLDTLNLIKYKKITKHDKLEEVLLGIEKAVTLGLKTKINCVPINDFNEEELVPIAAFAKDDKIDVRFIELMPIGLGKTYERIPYQKVKEMLEKVYGLSQYTNVKHGNGPALYYNFEGLKGSVGFISAITHEFCGDCNRIRMTAEGDMKLCLHHNQGVSLKPLLRNNSTPEKLRAVLEEAIYQKPNHHCFNQVSEREMEIRNMVQIGG